MNVQAITEGVSYTYEPGHLTAGASLGNPAAFAYFDPQSDLRGLWSAADSSFYLGSWDVRLFADGAPLQPARTVFTRGSQLTDFTAGRLSASKLFFLPFLDEAAAAASPELMQALVLVLELTNETDAEAQFLASHRLVFPAQRSPLFTKQPPEAESRVSVSVGEEAGLLLARTTSRPDEVRVFGADLGPFQLAHDERSAQWVSRVRVGPGKRVRARFVFAWSAKGKEAAVGCFHRTLEQTGLREETEQALRRATARSAVVTPDPLINRAVEWAKVNTLRVQHCYRTGAGFTNDPPQDIVVVRDLAWYVLGADHLTPAFSRGLLENAVRLARHEGGKLTEFYHAGEEKPERHDYHLNINDDTPLFLIAAWHHLLQHGDAPLLERFYPAMREAADWILAQREEGLVRCHAAGTNVWGICGWRNIIDGYNLTGAVTEINAECARALQSVSAAARRLDRLEDASRFEQAARELRDAVNTRLVSPRTGIYLLNIGDDGVEHHDVTGDAIIPVVFDVATPEVAGRVTQRLTADDFWTPYGVRTIPPSDPLFDPEVSYQLLGGVWPNLTAWVGWSLRERRPDLLAESMRRIYRISEPDVPAGHGYVVPGEFPERLHGVDFRSRGMAMSPWMPPTFLWLAVEGLMGFQATERGLQFAPHLPEDWRWAALLQVPVHGDLLDAFFHQGTVYATMQVTTPHALVTGRGLPVRDLPSGLCCLALESGGHLYVCAGTDRGASGTLTVSTSRGEVRLPLRLERGDAVVLKDPS